MKSTEAAARFDTLHVQVLRKELDPRDETYQNLKKLLEAGLRSCAICSRSNDQGDMVESFGSWAHIGCAFEYHQSLLVDPTTQRIGETDEQWKDRMERDFPHL